MIERTRSFHQKGQEGLLWGHGGPTKRLPQLIHLLWLGVNSSPCGHVCVCWAYPCDSDALTSATDPFPSQHIFCYLNTRSFEQHVCHRKTTAAVPLIRELGGFSVLQYCLLTHPSADSTSVFLSSCFELLFSFVVHLLKSFGDLKSILLTLKQSKPRGQINSVL